MKKQTTSISINILSVLVILMCVLLASLGTTNAWFTYERKEGVLVEIQVGALKLNVYQNLKGVETKLLTTTDNENPNTEKKQYVELEKTIEPDIPVDLVLTIKNEDPGSASMYVRFKFELYARGVSSDKQIDVEINDFTSPSTEENNVHDGFVLNEGYYYYKDSTGAVNAPFKRGATATLMQSFTVPYSSFMDSIGNMLLSNSDTLYIKLIVDASVSQNFNV